jgi:ribonucleotide reductase beta subunit family protein with ferritin-like domain
MAASKELLLSPDRLHIMPIKYDDMWNLYKKAEASFWTVEEVDLGNDRRDFETLDQNERHYILHVLTFFATADALVFDNIDSNFGEEIQPREAKSFYGFQRAIEGVHNEMYSVMIEALVQDQDTRAKILRTVEEFPAIKRKNDWARRFMSRDASFGERLLGFIVMEYLFFSASFAALFYFRKRNKMNGLGFSNELISRDEGLHAQFGCLLFNKYLHGKPNKEKILQMVREAVEIEVEFVRESLPVSLIGMNADSMSQYVQFVADHMLVAIGQEKIYGSENPFPWMELISLQGKTNFFEKRVAEYSKAGVGDKSDHVFSLDEDF